MADPYTRWRAELAGHQEPERQNVDTDISGWYRLEGAKTKPSWPVVIWVPIDSDEIAVRVGGKEFGSKDEGGATEFHEFIGSGWLHCIAVSKAAYDAARQTGRWPSDGKPARQMDSNEKLGIDVNPSSNQASADEAIEDQINAAVDTARKITKVTNADEARKANEMAERLNGLFKLGDAERDKQKRPHDEASKAVQSHWLPIITPAADERTRVIRLAKAWIKSEEDRLAADAEKERQARQAVIDAENERIRKENEARVAAQAEAGLPDEVPELVPEIAPAAPVAAPKVQAPSTFGRATGLRTVKKAKITDIVKLLTALSTHKEMLEFAQTLANRAAKAGIALDGMTIEETRE